MFNKKLFQLCLSVSLGLLAGAQADTALNSAQLPAAPVVQAPANLEQIYSLAQVLNGTVPGTNNLGANFGSAVALNGDYLFVGAANAAPNKIPNAGVLNIYKKDANGNYTPSQQITSLQGPNDLLGSVGSISSDGNWLFVSIGGSPNGEGASTRNGGLVQVYKLKEVEKVKTWVPKQQLQPADLALGDNFGGFRISLDAKAGWAFISAPQQDTITADGEEAIGGGAVYVYRFDAINKAWVNTQKITKPDGYSAPDTHFGVSTAIQGPFALIGSDNGNAGGNNGSVYAYLFVGGKWVNTQIITGDKPEMLDPVTQGDGFGMSVSIDGDWAVISAPLDSTQGVAEHGKVYFFKGKTRDGVKTWVKADSSLSDVSNQAGFLGTKVLVKGKNAFVTTLNRSDVDNRVYGGAVHLFQRSDNAWTLKQTFGGGEGYTFSGADFAYSPSRNVIAVGSFSNLDYYIPELPFARNFKNTSVAAQDVAVKIFKTAQ